MAPQSMSPSCDSKKWTKELVQEHAITAVLIEMYTLPFYLTVLTSIILPENDCPSNDNDSSKKNCFSNAVYKTILSICIEEMLHLQLAANLCIALDVEPSKIFQKPIYGKDIKYLNPDDKETKNHKLINAELGALNHDSLYTMLDIETPTEYESKANHTTSQYPYKTIGLMYEALLHGILVVEKDGPVFSWSTTGQQSLFTWGADYSKNALRINQTISSFGDAQQAIKLISEQGEGIIRSELALKDTHKKEDFIVEEAYRFYPKVETDSNDKNPEPDDPFELNQYSHYGRLLWIKNKIENEGAAWPKTYQCCSEDTPERVIILQSTAVSLLMQGFDNFIETMTNMWSGGSDKDFFTAMYKLKSLPTNCWKVGVVPQWTLYLPHGEQSTFNKD